MPTKKDLPAKKTVKGSGINLGNDNLTLVRASMPAYDAKQVSRPRRRLRSVGRP